MNFLEAKSLEPTLNKLYRELCTPYRDPILLKKLRSTWSDIICSGFDIISHRTSEYVNNYRIKTFTIKDPNTRFKRNNIVRENINMNPQGKFIGDCTTRTLAYIFKDTPYQQLREEQNQASRKFYDDNSHWNYDLAYSRVFSSHGYSKITLKRKVTRATIAKLLKDLPYPIATKSARHIAAIHQGKLIDTWNSAGGHVSDIYVPINSVHLVKPRLDRILNRP